MTYQRTINARIAEMHESVFEIHECDSAGRCKQASSQRRSVFVAAEWAEELADGPKPTKRGPRPDGSSTLVSDD